jgi:hypothetical protein
MDFEVGYLVAYRWVSGRAVREVGTSRSRVRGLLGGPCLGEHTRMRCRRCRRGMAVDGELVLA